MSINRESRVVVLGAAFLLLVLLALPASAIAAPKGASAATAARWATTERAAQARGGTREQSAASTLGAVAGRTSAASAPHAIAASTAVGTDGAGAASAALATRIAGAASTGVGTPGAVAASRPVPLQAAAAFGATAGQESPVALGSHAGAVPGALGVGSTAAADGGEPAVPATSATGGSEVGGASGTPVAGSETAETGVAPPRVKAGSVLLADEQTGQVLFAKDAEQQRAMASTTKVMTALLALERLDQRPTVVVGTEPTTVGEESLELRKGERFTVHQLLVGLLVKSANDAAVALADAVDGTEATFVRRMNRRAAELGLRETHYVTPYGLDRPGHHTSARDLARLWEVAMRRADFRALVSMRSGQLPGGPPQLRKFVNTNQLLGSYPWVVGGKTGFTDDAGRCLVASASRGGRRLVAVALDSTNAFPDVRALFDYGFTAFEWVRLARRGQPVTLAGPSGTTTYQATADTDALVRRDLLAKLSLAPPMRLVASGAPATTVAGAASATRDSAQPGAVSQSSAPSGTGESDTSGSRVMPSVTRPGASATTAVGSATSGTGAGGRLTVWVVAAGQRVALLRLGPRGEGALPPLARFAPGLVPAGSVAPAIDPFLRRAAA
jgi:D-alanyl-D-alanine carboxypeptidase (penicillin-binding protein 5/6)